MVKITTGLICILTHPDVIILSAFAASLPKSKGGVGRGPRQAGRSFCWTLTVLQGHLWKEVDHPLSVRLDFGSFLSAAFFF
jgi:hypothetical protein